MLKSQVLACLHYDIVSAKLCIPCSRISREMLIFWMQWVRLPRLQPFRPRKYSINSKQSKHIILRECKNVLKRGKMKAFDTNKVFSVLQGFIKISINSNDTVAAE